MEKKKNILRYAAGACFAGCATTNLVDLIRFGFDFGGLLLLVGFALIALSLFTSLPVLISAGAGVCAVYLLIELIFFGGRHILFRYLWFLAFFVILIVVSINKKAAKPLSFVAAGIAAIDTFFTFDFFTMGFQFSGGRTPLSVVLTSDYWKQAIANSRDFYPALIPCVLMIAAALLMGMYFDSMKPKVHKNPVTSNGRIPASPAESQIDRLTKLKGLLDRGVITQEEFETKKNQILGS